MELENAADYLKHVIQMHTNFMFNDKKWLRVSDGGEI